MSPTWNTASVKGLRRYWGSEQQTPLRRQKIIVEQIKVQASPKQGYYLSYMHLSLQKCRVGTVAEMTGEAPLGVLPGPGRDRNMMHPHRAAALSCAHRALPHRATHEETAERGKNFPSYTGRVENMFHQPTSAKAQTPALTKWHACLQKKSIVATSPLFLEKWVL